ncbi:hypothetical protein [Streptomyces carpaticus]|uniref:Uncharacterized protein n=1 Tax=Streptomyces carpaticus TaxID=285558 RepID=A0ABV4ZJY0_9ACTN
MTEFSLSRMADGMVDGEAELVFALGLTVRAAAAVEYTLHEVAVRLHHDGPAYGYQGKGYVSKLITACRSEATLPIPAGSQRLLQPIIDEAERLLEQRNGYVHGRWAFDADRHVFVRVRGKAEHPEIEVMEAEEVHALAVALEKVEQQLIAWEASTFDEARKCLSGPCVTSDLREHIAAGLVLRVP